MLACVLVLLFQVGFTTVRSRLIKAHISPLTMIPRDTGGPTFDRSVCYDTGDVCATLADIDAFLKNSGVPAAEAFKINLCCEELMTNLATYAQGKITSHTFDVHIQINADGIFVTLKDAGRPFDPVTAGRVAGANGHMGLRLVTGIVPDITYKYMYGQNTVFICHKL